MRLADRIRALNEVADFLASKSEVEADTILRMAGFSTLTPSDWGRQSESAKRVDLVHLLSRSTNQAALEELWDCVPGRVQLQDKAMTTATVLSEVDHDADGPIFVVHGHARATLHEAVRVLERGTGREVIVLHEQANAGRTILEKFEDHANSASFAVVLLTGDDQGGVATDTVTQPRGRQNVIFEFGFFFGKLGRSRVAVLIEDGVEKPSDVDGLVYIAIDSHGAWKQALAKELENAGISVDRARMP